MPQKKTRVLSAASSKAKSQVGSFNKPEQVEPEVAEQEAPQATFLAGPQATPGDSAKTLLRMPGEQARQQVLRSLQENHGNAYVGNVIRSMQKSRTTPTVARDFTRVDEDNKTGAPKTKDFDGGKQTTSTVSDNHGWKSGWETGTATNGTKSEDFIGSQHTKTTTTHDVTGKTSLSDVTNNGIGNKTTTTNGDVTDTNSKFLGVSSTKTSTNEVNGRDLIVSQGYTTNDFVGNMDKTERTEKNILGPLGSLLGIESVRTDKTEHFTGAEANSNLTAKTDLNSANVKGGGDFFVGDRNKKSSEIAIGTQHTNTSLNQAQTGLGVLESLLGDKEFLTKTLGLKFLEKAFTEKKNVKLHEGKLGKYEKTETNPGLGAEVLYKIGKALGETDPEKQKEALEAALKDLDDDKKFDAFAALISDHDQSQIAELVSWLDTGKPPVDIEVIKTQITLVTSPLVTKGGKSRNTSSKEIVKGAHTKTEYNTKTTAGSAEGSISNKTRIGYANVTSKTKRGNVGDWEGENTFTNDFTAGGRFEGSLGGKISASGITGSLNASAMLGVQDTLTNNSSLTSSDGKKKFENKFKAQGTAGAKGDVAAKGEIGITGVNLSLDASAMAGLEGLLEDSVEFTYRGHKIFTLKGTLRGNLGVGARFGGKVIFKDGRLVISAEMGVTLGIGGSVGFEIDVNFRELGSLIITAIVDAFKKIGSYIVSGLKKIGSFFKKLFGYGKEDKKVTEATKQGGGIKVEETKSIEEAAKKVGEIPNKLENVKKLSEKLPDTSVTKALEKVSSVSHKLSHKLSNSANKLEEASSKPAETKTEAKQKVEELETVKKEVKAEALQANDELKSVAKN